MTTIIPAECFTGKVRTMTPEEWAALRRRKARAIVRRCELIVPVVAAAIATKRRALAAVKGRRL